ncbi:MAG: hypothetical protein HF976_03275 [ANME-2 cluster archaeon]|nr:hypothetical protein [ANME-2 cluster archaeon]MBC2700424.1 hypothetical protein [ANME-2 cluster archaeon]MBC2747073.1 hypothetical protein [ANME-2 cluster archaeon]
MKVKFELSNRNMSSKLWLRRPASSGLKDMGYTRPVTPASAVSTSGACISLR